MPCPFIHLGVVFGCGGQESNLRDELMRLCWDHSSLPRRNLVYHKMDLKAVKARFMIL